MPSTQATASGDLGRTPFAHLAVYAFDRKLTGALFLNEPSGVEHTVRFARGLAVKIKPSDRYALLGEILVETGALDRKTLEQALATQGLLGDVLMLAGCVDRDTIERAAEEQFVRRMVRLFALSPGTTYRYYDGHSALLDWGAGPSDIDPLALLWAGVRAHGEASALMGPTLATLGDTPLRLHTAATFVRFCLSSAEAEIAGRLCASPISLGALLSLNLGPEMLVKKLVYALMITRQIDFGSGVFPLGASEQGRSKLARIGLKSQVHRQGAAAPDRPGAGEPQGLRPKTGPQARVDVEAIKQMKAPPDEDPPEVEVREEMLDDDLAELVAPSEGPSLDGLRQRIVERFAEGDLDAALAACHAARALAPHDHDLHASSVWIRSKMKAPDLKVLLVELDELLRADDVHVEARYYRALLRRRMGDEAGAEQDLRKLIELYPDHAEAAAELASLQGNKQSAAAPEEGLLRRLFGSRL